MDIYRYDSMFGCRDVLMPVSVSLDRFPQCYCMHDSRFLEMVTFLMPFIVDHART